MDTWRIFVNPYVCVKFRYQQYEFIFIFQYVKKKYLKKKKTNNTQDGMIDITEK